MKNSTWGIVGAGWLGKEIISRLNQADIKCWSTNRKNFDWAFDAFPTNFCDILFLNTPPLTNLNPEQFVQKIPKDSKKVIFISSTSVYGSASGPVSESTSPEPVTQNGIWLHQVEQLLLDQFKGCVSIIRPGGLIGGERHPIFSLSRRPEIVVEDAPINLIHRDDLIEIIFAVSKLKWPPDLINAVAPYHPMKSEYYGAWSNFLNCAELRFSASKSPGKIVTSQVLPSIFSDWHHSKLDRL
jgi:hypothetical protein